MSFSLLGLQPAIQKAVEQAGYTQPTPIQQQAIPAVLAGRDLLAAAQTGTGKTAGFVLPILQRLSQTKSKHPRPTRALILTPTRELAAQISEQITKYSQFLEPKLKHLVVFGGVNINPQMMGLRGGVDILTATPGRLLDLIGQNAVKINEVEVLVLDEADRMLDMGFIRDIQKILNLLPKVRQNLLFSATFDNEIKSLTNKLLKDPLMINVAPENSTAEKIEQKVYHVTKGQKTGALISLIEQNNWQQVLVFMATKHEANRLTEKLEAAGITAAAIHGNKSQNARTAALAGFKSNEVRVLVASDVAARGIDIAQLPFVVNFALPRSAADYVHRIGRTGRAGMTGLAVSLVCPDEIPQLKQVEKLIGMKIPVAELSGIPSSNHNDHDLTVRPPRPPRPQAKKPAAAGQKPATAGGANSAGGARPAAPRRPRPAGAPAQQHNAGGHNAGGNGQGQRPAPRRSNPAPQRQGNN
ncbi:DEAD/DEAH box helicase [Rheinheimera riviphila]|uniref:DEAD-box ATP-dependent RNA helicase RhpA n=1 Tax=Rheinheimera riviphila TaxID=1834037 RepID=A0A437QJ47_9GAMM|nr:DEAD/DEAH box helicase [Rheinheimera riviphila]RVU34533.1 DEAD/DEAH box helicase [Rheinheimera riviphila]